MKKQLLGEFKSIVSVLRKQIKTNNFYISIFFSSLISTTKKQVLQGSTKLYANNPQGLLSMLFFLIFGAVDIHN